MSTALFAYTRDNLRLSEALAAFAALEGMSGATAILYSPRRCELAVLRNGTLHNSNGQPVDLGTVFEARIFNEKAELRWLNDPGPQQRHQAAILAEVDYTAKLGGWKHDKRSDIIAKLPQTYLLWGEGTGQSPGNGWSELATARIGALHVPLANVGRNERVLLHSVEYIVEAEHGNAAIFDERLLKLEVARG